MKKLTAIAALGLALILPQLPLHAGPLGDSIKVGMSEAREGLLGLLEAPDAAAQSAKLTAIQAGTAKVDAALAGADATKVAEFTTIWTEFKKTRDTEIIPAIQAGDKNKAKTLAEGIQAERIAKMKTILGGL